MSNTSQIYQVNSTETFTGLMTQVDTLSGGALGPLMVFGVFAISYFSLQGGSGGKQLQAAAFVSWLTSVFLVLLGVFSVALSGLLLLVVVALTAYTSRGAR